MSFQLHDILSNPALLKEVPDDQLQKWIQQYPYVSLFHLYALKRKGNYTETDLHKTAFYFNNREKLFYLLNDTHFDSRIVSPSFDKTTNVISPVEIKEEISAATIIDTISEKQTKVQEEILVTEEEKTEIVVPAEETIINATENQDITQPEETTIEHKEEVVSIDEVSTAALEEETVMPVIEEIKEEVITEEYKTEAIITPVIPVTDKPLSIAEQIMLEIQQLKEERARKENQPVVEETIVQEETILPEFETVQDTTEVIDIIEEDKVEENTEAQETISEDTEIEEEQTTELVEEKETPEDKPEIVEATIVTPAIIDEPVIVEEKKLSIQDEVIARIQKLKEERERKLPEVTETPAPEIIETKEEETITEEPLQKEEEIKEVVEEKELHEVKPEIIEAAETKEEEHKEENIEPEIVQEQQVQKTPEKTTIPLSIQDEVIARIQRIKEEREKQIQEFADSRSTPAIDEKPVIIDETITEEISKTEEIEVVNDPEKLEVAATLTPETTEKPLSIQDEVIARIQKIKEERARKLAGEELSTPVSEEIKTEIPVEETIEPATKTETIAATTEPATEHTEETETAEITEKSNEETVEEAIIEALPLTGDIKIVEKTERVIIPAEIEDEKNPLEDIISISPAPEFEKDIELIETKLQEEVQQEMEDVDVLATIHEPEHTIHEIAPAHTETSIIDILPHTETEETLETPETTAEKAVETKGETEELDRFAEIFPQPLLVKVDTAELKNEKTTVTLEQLQEEVIVPIASVSVEDKTIIKEIIEEDLKEQGEAIDDTALISPKSDLFIPNVEEDVIEEHIIPEIITDKEIQVETVPEKTQVVHEQSIEDEIPAQKLDEAVIKEPHTFVEWLKLLDGNLQIQTSETLKEPDNWIEIPRYEVEQTIAHKKEIQKEEQKLFEPNFEEGEVDLFNEIDEAVTKVASESVSFKQDMMTETLAKIYHKQGKTDKALEIYNTLLLKFPEKSAYFAALIEKIEKEK